MEKKNKDKNQKKKQKCYNKTKKEKSMDQIKYKQYKKGKLENQD